MKIVNKKIVTSATMNATINSLPMPLEDIYGFAIQCVITGTPTGSLKLQASCDPFTLFGSGGLVAPTNWVDVPSSSIAVSAAGNQLFNINGAFYTFVRLVYTDTSGGTSTAVLNATFSGKGE